MAAPADRQLLPAAAARRLLDGPAVVARHAPDRHPWPQGGRRVGHGELRSVADALGPGGVNELHVREVVQVAVLADDEETRGHARAPARHAERCLPQALRVHVLGQVRAPPPPVDQLELARRVQRAEPVAARAAHPPRERRHRHAGTRERVIVGIRIPRRVPQRPDLRSEYPLHRLQQARLVDRILVLGVPRVQAAHDHAHRRQVDGRADPGGRDEVARPCLPDPGGSTALPGTGNAEMPGGSRRNGHAGPPEVERS